MEICINMDSSSHFNFGMNSQRTIDANYNYNEVDESSASTSKNYPKRHCPEYQTQRDEAFHWRSDSVECKQEGDPMNSSLNSDMQEGGSYDSENEFNEPYAYDYDQNPPSYAAHRSSGLFRPNQQLNQPRMGPYQLTSSKSHLPNWYNPPMPPESYFPRHPSVYQQQAYPYQQDNDMGSPTADRSMRNMIHLTSRYLSSQQSILQLLKTSRNNRNTIWNTLIALEDSVRESLSSSGSGKARLMLGIASFLEIDSRVFHGIAADALLSCKKPKHKGGLSSSKTIVIHFSFKNGWIFGK